MKQIDKTIIREILTIGSVRDVVWNLSFALANKKNGKDNTTSVTDILARIQAGEVPKISEIRKAQKAATLPNYERQCEIVSQFAKKMNSHYEESKIEVKDQVKYYVNALMSRSNAPLSTKEFITQLQTQQAMNACHYEQLGNEFNNIELKERAANMLHVAVMLGELVSNL